MFKYLIFFSFLSIIYCANIKRRQIEDTFAIPYRYLDFNKEMFEKKLWDIFRYIEGFNGNAMKVTDVARSGGKQIRSLEELNKQERKRKNEVEMEEYEPFTYLKKFLRKREITDNEKEIADKDEIKDKNETEGSEKQPEEKLNDKDTTKIEKNNVQPNPLWYWIPLDTQFLFPVESLYFPVMYVK